MAGQSTKWVLLVATIWIQAFTGTNFDFSSYSSKLKSVLGMSQVHLNYLAVASDMGKAFGWCSGVTLAYFSPWVVMLMAAFMGFLGYGLQWLLIQRIVSLPYFLVYLLCLLAGCSICWFNTVCYVSCIQNFPSNRALALSLIVSFNGVSAALYTLIANALHPNDEAFYLFLNTLVPLIISALALFPILYRPPPAQPLSTDATRHEFLIFLCLYVIAVITGLYLLIFNSAPSHTSRAHLLLAGAVVLLVLPLCSPGIIGTRKGVHRIISTSKFWFNNSSFDLIDPELHEELIDIATERNGTNGIAFDVEEKESILRKAIEKESSFVLEEEHPAKLLIRRMEFWLYYVAYLCGGTIGLVYSNNLGQISQSLGYSSSTGSLVTLYSSCSFFGRLISAAPDFMREKVNFARTGWLALALVPTPIAFILLAASSSSMALHAGTGLIGLSSGFVSSAAVSITSELFGPNSAGVNHNILITNIPLGSFLYGLLGAVVYDSSAGSSNRTALQGGAVVCMGRKCYLQTFVWWAAISLIGVTSSLLLFRRTKPAYDRLFESNRSKAQSL